MIEVRTLEQLNSAVRKLRAAYARGLGSMELIRHLGIDPITELRGGDWRGTNFAGCDLRDVDFSECRLAFCDFTDSDVAGAVFYGADLYRSTLHRAINVSFSYLSEDQRAYLDFCIAFDRKNRSPAGRRFQINQRIRAATTFQGARIQFERLISDGLEPDEYSASLLIRRARSSQEAWKAFDLVEAAGGRVNQVVFVALASKMRATRDIHAVIGEMKSKAITPGIRIYNTLLARTRSRDEIEATLDEMRNNGIMKDNFTYRVLMSKAKSFSERRKLFFDLIDEGLHAGVSELNMVLASARNEDQADLVIEIANEHEIGRDIETYSLLAAHKTRPGAFRTLMGDMIEDELRPNSKFYETALRRTTTFGNACFLYGRMKSAGLTPDHRTYIRFAQLAGVPILELSPVSTDEPESHIESLIRLVGSADDTEAAGLAQPQS